MVAAASGQRGVGQHAVDGERALEHAVLLGQRAVEPAVLDRHRALGGERARQRDLDRRELARPPRAHVQRADDRLAREHRAAEHRADPLAEDRVADPGRGERSLARVVRDRDRRARRDRHAADAVAEREPHPHERFGARPDRDPHLQRVAVDEPHPREVGAEQLARTLDDQVQRGVDVGLGGLDLHADLDQRLVGGGPPCLHLDLLGQQREVLGEHRHQRAGVAGADAAAQVRDQRAAHRAVDAEHRLDAVDQ